MQQFKIIKNNKLRNLVVTHHAITYVPLLIVVMTELISVTGVFIGGSLLIGYATVHDIDNRIFNKSPKYKEKACCHPDIYSFDVGHFGKPCTYRGSLCGHGEHGE